MTTVGEDFIAFLVADTTGVNDTVSGRVHQNVVPQGSVFPHIWIGRTEQEKPRTNDKAGGITRARFDVECKGGGAGASIELADKVKDRIDNYQGAFGNSRAQGIFVEDHDDDYIPKGGGLDEGIHSADLDVLIWFST